MEFIDEKLKKCVQEVNVTMEFMGTKEASEKWGIPQQAITKMCRAGKILNAEQDSAGSPWRIPCQTERPKYTPRKR